MIGAIPNPKKTLEIDFSVEQITSTIIFIPLKDNDKWVKGPLNNKNAAPVNFLIDQEGRIIYSNFRIDGQNEASLELMINSVLNRKK